MRHDHDTVEEYDDDDLEEFSVFFDTLVKEIVAQPEFAAAVKVNAAPSPGSLINTWERNNICANFGPVTVFTPAKDGPYYMELLMVTTTADAGADNVSFELDWTKPDGSSASTNGGVQLSTLGSFFTSFQSEGLKGGSSVTVKGIIGGGFNYGTAKYRMQIKCL
jgi:hypothetical protein